MALQGSQVRRCGTQGRKEMQPWVGREPSWGEQLLCRLQVAPNPWGRVCGSLPASRPDLPERDRNWASATPPGFRGQIPDSKFVSEQVWLVLSGRARPA